MRNRSNIDKFVEFEPISLDSDFPVTDPLFETPPLNQHIHDCFEVGFCFEGGGVFIIEEKIFTCSAPCAVFINNREFHTLKNATPENTKWKFINLDPVKLLGGHVFADEKIFNLEKLSGSLFRNIVTEGEGPDITNLVKDLIAELEMKREGYKDIVRSQVWLILQKLQRFAPERSETSLKSDSESFRRIAAAIQFIAQKYAERVTVEDLAKLCSCSLSNFRKIFVRAIGCPPQEYLVKFRLNMASLLLRNSSKQIIKISSEVGFPTLSNFNRSFKQHFGETPRQFRSGKS